VHRTRPRPRHRRSASPTASSSGSLVPAQLTIAQMTAADWPAVIRIYEAGIAGGNATFEPHAPSFEDWRQAHIDDPCLVAREGSGGEDGAVHGWAALGPISPRPVYRGVAEVSIYVDPAQARRGVGRALLSALVECSEQAGFWTLVAGIFPENTASIELHLACGFEPAGVRKRIGQMPGGGRWRDVAFYERRSRIVGAD
jgi:L-amino acid N-acyltransferase YncA